MSLMARKDGSQDHEGLIGCFNTYLLFPINTQGDVQAATAHRGVKTKHGSVQPRLCGVLGSVFPHLTHLCQRLPNCLGGLRIV